MARTRAHTHIHTYPLMSWRKLIFPWLRDREIIAENNLMCVDLGLNVPGTVVAVGYFAAGQDSERK